jgi:hypothetical protein
MSRELDLLAKEFHKTPVTVLRTEVSLYQQNVQIASAAFIRKIEQESKRLKTPNITIVAIIESS